MTTDTTEKGLEVIIEKSLLEQSLFRQAFSTDYDRDLCLNKRLLTYYMSVINNKLQFGHVINVPTKTTVLGLFNFRALLNLSMLLVGSEKARHLRSKILVKGW